MEIVSQSQNNNRKDRGIEIAKTARILKAGNQWKVPSQSGNEFYVVTSDGHETTCTCPDHKSKYQKCKHIWAVELIETGQIHGNIVDPAKETSNDCETTEIDPNEAMTIPTCEIRKPKRKTYKQDWKS